MPCQSHRSVDNERIVEEDEVVLLRRHYSAQRAISSIPDGRKIQMGMLRGLKTRPGEID